MAIFCYFFSRFFLFLELGIFLFKLGKKHTFWHWEHDRISVVKTGQKNPAKFTHFYQLDGYILHQVPENPYLGVTISEDLKWSSHTGLSFTLFWGRNLAPFPMPKSMFFSTVPEKIPNLTKKLFLCFSSLFHIIQIQNIFHRIIEYNHICFFLSLFS